MNNLRKLTGIISRILFALMLALALINVTSCEDMMGIEEASQGGKEQGNEQDKEQGNEQGKEQSNEQGSEVTVPPTYDDFNKADYVIINETGKPDSEIAWLKEIIWLGYAEREYAGDWTANYVKTNKIKTILSDKWQVHAWIDPDLLDGIYLNANLFNTMLSFYKEDSNNAKAVTRKNLYEFFTHETMHLVQYKSGAFKLMTGMRPDICAAVDMLTEYLAWFYTDYRYPGTDVSADMENAVETQSKYMILSTDPWAYDDACAKDPSLPPFIHSEPWFNNSLSNYAQHAFTVALVRESAMTSPLRQASKEDMLKVARAMLACRDPKQAGVTDDALWTVFDALRKAATGNSKYHKLNDGWGCNPDSFNNFQEVIIANWDEAYAAQ